MKHNFARFAAVAAAGAMAFTLTACGSSDSSADANAESVYYLSFKPEQDAIWQEVAKEYTKETGVPVKVVTAASNTYEQTLKAEVTKKDAPTLFQGHGPIGMESWLDYTADLRNTDFYKALVDPGMAVGKDGKVYGVPYVVEGYGIIYNAAILKKYFGMEGAKATSVDEIKGFDKLKEVVEDMQAKKADLGIEGVFAATSLSPGEDWRWQTHLANYPVYYEYRDAKVDDLDEVKLTYSDNYKKIFDLYLNNSTIKPTEASAKTVTDSMADFALGKAAMVQNGNWGWSQISEVSGNTVKAEDVHFMPIYIGVSGEDKSNIAIGTENYLTINSQAAEGDQKATKDFLTWLFTDAEGSKMAAEKLSIIAPYKAYAELAPSDPLGKEVSAAINNKDLTPVKWVFPTFPSQDFKDQLGQHLAQYASGSEDWAKVKDFFVTTWASEKKASKEG